jgi:hypothetical protein
MYIVTLQQFARSNNEIPKKYTGEKNKGWGESKDDENLNLLLYLLKVRVTPCHIQNAPDHKRSDGPDTGMPSRAKPLHGFAPCRDPKPSAPECAYPIRPRHTADPAPTAARTSRG